MVSAGRLVDVTRPSAGRISKALFRCRLRLFWDPSRTKLLDDGDNGTFIGTYTPVPCWTVSPHPLPGYGQPETKTFWVTYAPDSCSERDITITYYSQGFGSQTYPCFYKITYPLDGSWKYSATAGPYTACSVATAPPSANYDENLYFKIVDT